MFHDGGKLPGQIEKQFENFDEKFERAFKYGKYILLFQILGGIGVFGFIAFVVVHFVRKFW
jgi:hypothetical protein